jgi:hypothetical protein
MERSDDLPPAPPAPKGWYAKQQARHEAAKPENAHGVKVMKFKGERELQRGIEKMLAKGWTIDQSSSRKAMYSLATGIFTRKQIHTVIFTKDA